MPRACYPRPSVSTSLPHSLTLYHTPVPHTTSSEPPPPLVSTLNPPRCLSTRTPIGAHRTTRRRSASSRAPHAFAAVLALGAVRRGSGSMKTRRPNASCEYLRFLKFSVCLPCLQRSRRQVDQRGASRRRSPRLQGGIQDRRTPSLHPRRMCELCARSASSTLNVRPPSSPKPHECAFPTRHSRQNTPPEKEEGRRTFLGAFRGTAAQRRGVTNGLLPGGRGSRQSAAQRRSKQGPTWHTSPPPPILPTLS